MELKVLVILVVRIFVIRRNRNRIFPTIVPVEKLAEFDRRAVLAAQGTGNLQVVLELTRAIQEIDGIENKGQRCFTKFRHTITTHKWTF